MHAITVCLPMGDLLSYYIGSRAQQDTKLLVQTLDKWLSQDKDKHKHTRSLIVHTFCAGWLAYLSWDDYFMAIAFHSAQRSKDPNRQV
uniref:Uncharacterized protein n=1 Tax=Picea sitchensis TaxID=3332 RepID=D5ACW6_PICSI|nr:unknown [Picea sitchensis]